MVRRFPVAFVLLVALSAPVTGSASAASWSPPVDVSTPSLFIENPFIGFGSSGVGLASWVSQRGIGAGAQVDLRVASRSVSGAYSPERGGLSVGPPPVVYGRNRVLAVGEDPVARRPALSRIQLAFGRTDGRFERPRTVDVAQLFGNPALGANAVGYSALAYVKSVRGRRVARLVERRAGRWQSPRAVTSRRGVNRVTVTLGQRRRLAVAWERDGKIEVRVRRRNRLGPVMTVGRAVRLGTSLRAAVGSGGRIWIVWASQRLSEGGDNGPYELYAAVSTLRGTRFRRPRLLDRFDRRASDEAGFDLSIGGDGNAFVAWSSFDGQNFRARLASLNKTGRRAHFTTLSQPGYDAAVRDLAFGPRGDGIAVWSRLDAVRELGDAVIAGYLSADGSFQGEEQVSRGDRARRPSVAFNPVTGLPTVVWSQRVGPDGPGTPLEQIRTLLRASDRTP
jgi:hypothetical protein